MIDSEDSTSPRGIGRREVLGGAAGLPLLTEWEPSVGNPEDEPLAHLWREWKRLHNHTVILCYRNQDLEARLLRTLGPPLVLVRSLGSPDGVPAWTHEDIDRILAATENVVSSEPTLHAELSFRKGRWSAEVNRLGFEGAMEEEGDAWQRESEATSAIFRTAATTLIGVQIKIALMIQMCLGEAADRSFPLPQLESAFRDLAVLVKNQCSQAGNGMDAV